MIKTKTNISAKTNTGSRRKVDIIAGESGPYTSGDILDANATKQLVDNVADRVGAIMDMAPENFDTLKEAADAITSLLSSIPTKISDLENDVPYVTEDEMKLEGVDNNEHAYVDLGLPSGTLWATCNIGANSSELEGNTYSPTDVVDVESLWGGGWHVPTEEQWLELINNTDWRSPRLGYIRMTSRINGNGITFHAYTQDSPYARYSASSGRTMIVGNNGVNTLFSNAPGLVRPVLNRSLIDKYATKQELTAEIRRAQTVEATKANTADLATIATTGSYNDLTNKPTIPNVAVVNIEEEDTDTSTSPFTIINQNKISQVCDLLDAGTVVFGTFSNMGPNITAIWTMGGTSPTQATLYMSLFIPLMQSTSPLGSWYVFASADVSSRYVTSNTEP